MRVGLVGLLISSAALGQVPTPTEAKPPNIEDAMHARNYGMGGAYRSLGYGAEAITGNPAALSLYRRYQVELSGAYDTQNKWGWGGIAIADSVTSEVAGGASYQMVSMGDGPTRRTVFLTTLASAYALTGFLHLGLAVRHQVVVGYNETNSATISAGLIFNPFDELTIGFSGHNLVADGNSDIHRFFSFAVSSLLWQQFTPTLEMRAVLDDLQHPLFAVAGGMEWLIGQTIPIRFGYEYDMINGTQHVGMGLGYFNEGSGVDLSYRHELGGTEGKMIALTLKMQFN